MDAVEALRRRVIGHLIEPTGDDWRATIELRDAARTHILRHCGGPDLP